MLTITLAIASFAGLFYTSLWLGGKFHVMDNRGETWKTLLIMIPILAATLVAVSRIMDARHHPFDVISGGFLGIVCALVSYHQYFPPLSEPWRKGRAYPIRTWGTEPPHPLTGERLKSRESAVALRDPDADRLSALNPRDRSVSPSGQPTDASGYGTNPFIDQPSPRRPHDHDPDGNWSSSEDDVGDGYEMQRGYAMAANPGVGGYPASLTPATDTAYQSQTAGAGVGGYPPPDVVVSHSDRGRPLTDMPGRQV